MRATTIGGPALLVALLVAGCENAGPASQSASTASSEAPSTSAASPAPVSSSPVPTTPVPTGSATQSPTPTSTPGPTETPAPSAARVSVYLLANGKLVAAHRVVDGPAVANAAVQALLAAPSVNERGVGYSSAIPTATVLRGIDLAGDVARVDLSPSFGSGSTPAQLRTAARTAQVVFTLTQFPTVRSVTVIVGGTSLGAALTRADFEDLMPAVLIESPTVGDVVSSPVRVYGSANTFEAVFQLEVTDWDGRIVASATVHATSGTGTRGTFDVTLPYTTNLPGSGEIIASLRSPKDGSRTVVSEIPVTVEP
jgi:Immunoglobulin-like domain of bacterial spore germination/Sporulation and spore germination